MKQMTLITLVIQSFLFGDFITGDKIILKVTSNVAEDTTPGWFIYSYKVVSLPSSEQNLWCFAIKKLPDYAVFYPRNIGIPHWGASVAGFIHMRTMPGSPDTVVLSSLGRGGINWSSSDSTFDIVPGDSLINLSYHSPFMPDIKEYYAEGEHPLPWFPEGEAPDTPLHGYDDLTPYGPGIVGKTVGPGLPPPMKPIWPWGHCSDSAFIHLLRKNDTLYYDLHWIKREQAYEQIKRRINHALDHLWTGRIEQCKSVLTHLLDYLDRVRGDEITDEAYFILYYRVRYVRDNVWYGNPGKK